MSAHADVEKLLSDVIGLDPESIGRASLRSEIDSLMSDLMLDDPDAYARLLRQDKEELGRLVERVVVPETWFFRDRESFRYLKQYARRVAREERGGPVRILSAPCSTGEEPYSIVMTLLDAGLAPDDFRVHGVDISGKALERAKRAEYGRTSFRGEKQHPDHYFIPIENGWKLLPAVKDLVDFTQENILGDGFPTGHRGYRIVFCRNMLIYLNQEARRRLFELLDRLLPPGGLLFTGHSELPSFLERGYTPVSHGRSFACMRPDGNGSPELQTSAPVRPKGSGWGKYVKKAEPLASVLPIQDQRKERTGPDVRAAEAPPSLAKIRRLADRGSLAEASALCEKYLEERTPDKEGFYLMGLINEALNRPEEAESLFMKTLYLDPFHYEALLHMLLLSERKGDEAKAEVFRERIKRLNDRPTISGGRM